LIPDWTNFHCPGTTLVRLHPTSSFGTDFFSFLLGD